MSGPNLEGLPPPPSYSPPSPADTTGSSINPADEKTSSLVLGDENPITAAQSPTPQPLSSHSCKVFSPPELNRIIGEFDQIINDFEKQISNADEHTSQTMSNEGLDQIINGLITDFDKDPPKEEALRILDDVSSQADEVIKETAAAQTQAQVEDKGYEPMPSLTKSKTPDMAGEMKGTAAAQTRYVQMPSETKVKTKEEPAGSKQEIPKQDTESIDPKRTLRQRFWAVKGVNKARSEAVAVGSFFFKLLKSAGSVFSHILNSKTDERPMTQSKSDFNKDRITR